jgi:hypothetical protein
MATPIRTDIGNGLESVRNTMIDFVLVCILLNIGRFSVIVYGSYRIDIIIEIFTVSASTREMHLVTTFV